MYNTLTNSPKIKFKAMKWSYLQYSADFLPIGSLKDFQSVSQVSYKLGQKWPFCNLLSVVLYDRVTTCTVKTSYHDLYINQFHL